MRSCVKRPLWERGSLWHLCLADGAYFDGSLYIGTAALQLFQICKMAATDIIRRTITVGEVIKEALCRMAR